MTQVAEWLTQARDWLDRRGKMAWIAAFVLGFIFFWPVGLALLFYVIWSNRLMSCKHRRQHPGPFRNTGNVAFDGNRDETLKRLEEEQSAFEGFLERLRQAKDRAEFDQFMTERKSAPTDATPA